MIALKYLLAVCFAGSAIAQGDEGSGVEITGRSCYVGEGDSYQDIESKRKGCKFLENACQSKVEVSKDGIRVYGECKELSVCEGNAAGRDCYSQLLTKTQAAESEHVCHYCCQGNLCNTALFTEAGVQESEARLIFR